MAVQRPSMTRVSARWLGKKEFEGTDSRGRKMKMAPPPGDGFSPMEMLLMASAGCSGMDIASILEKKKEPLRGLTVEAEGEKTKSAPYLWEKVRLRYIVEGDVSEDALKEAIALSMEKYCSCSITLGKSAKITTEHVIERP